MTNLSPVDGKFFLSFHSLGNIKIVSGLRGEEEGMCMLYLDMILPGFSFKGSSSLVV